MARKTSEELELLMKKHKVDTVWSWSRYNTYCNSPYEFFLKYVLNEPTDADPSIYLVSGGGCHEIIEDYYNGVIQYDEMIDKYEELLFAMQMQGLKYNRVDEEKDRSIGDTYEACIREFFKNHKPIESKPIIEKFLDIRVGKYLFQGYLDVTFKKDGYVIIGDWKTSTVYTGAKAEKESGQLKLYTLGLVQKGIPLENIKYGWNFLKYYNVTYTLKNGKTKTQSIERNIPMIEVKSIRSSILSNLKERGYSEDLIYDLPQDILDLYKIEDCWVLQDITMDKLMEFKDKVEADLDEIMDRMKEYEETQDEDIWLGEIVDAKNDYYFFNLCGYTTKKHKPFAEYIEMSKMFMIEED